MKKILIFFVLILIFSSCSHQITKTKITKELRTSCIVSKNPNISLFLENGKTLNITGDNCSINLKLLNTTYDSAIIKTSENETLEVFENEPKYSDSDFYIHLVNVYDNGARISINKNIFYNSSEDFLRFKTCFTNPDCKLSCNDFDGFHSAHCQNNTITASKLIFRNKIKDSDLCCINYPNTYYILPSQELYSKGETIKLFFMGPANQPCSIKLISRENKSFPAGQTLCKPFSQIVSKDLYSSYGEYYGTWNAVVNLPSRFGQPWNLNTKFKYFKGKLIFKDLVILPKSTIHFQFLGKNYSLTHMDGCDYGVHFSLNNASNFTLNVGGMTNLPNFNLVLQGAPCRKGKKISLRIQKQFKNKCNNGYCEAGENKDNCPWDCMDIKPVSSHLEDKTQCTSGCYSGFKCLARGSLIELENKTFICDKNEWENQ